MVYGEPACYEVLKIDGVKSARDCLIDTYGPRLYEKEEMGIVHIITRSNAKKVSANLFDVSEVKGEIVNTWIELIAPYAKGVK